MPRSAAALPAICANALAHGSNRPPGIDNHLEPTGSGQLLEVQQLRPRVRSSITCSSARLLLQGGSSCVAATPRNHTTTVHFLLYHAIPIRQLKSISVYHKLQARNKMVHHHLPPDKIQHGQHFQPSRYLPDTIVCCSSHCRPPICCSTTWGVRTTLL